MKHVFILVYSFALNFVFSQIPNTTLSKVEADCQKAIEITNMLENKYGPTVAPKGYGEVQEFRNINYVNKNEIEAEHNSAWYKITAKSSGKVNLMIIPKNRSNDYDFMVFKATDTSTCRAIRLGQIKPIRSNLSRTGKGCLEVTGLHKNGKKDFTFPGVGNPFSNLLEVQKGEKYYILVDNVYDKGEGHTVVYGYLTKAQFSGKVVDENNKSQDKALVKLKDEFGNVISETTSNAEGNYVIQTEVNSVLNHSISISCEKKFPSIINLKKEDLFQKKYNLTSLNATLPTLLVNEKFVLEGIYFHGHSDEPVANSINAIEMLYELMKNYPTMKVRIEGHVNEPEKNISEERETFSQTLSDYRALRIYSYLLERGINKDRISYIGFSNKFMIFPNPETEEQMEKNRRVEINVLSL